MAKSAVSGLGTGVLSIPGLPGDIAALAEKGGEKAGWGEYLSGKAKGANQAIEDFWAKYTYYDPEKTKRMREQPGISQAARSDVPGTYGLPTTQDLQSTVEKATGKFYEPQTEWGKGTHTAFAVAPTLYGRFWCPYRW